MCEGGEGPQNGVWKPPQDCLALLPPSVPPHRLCVHPVPCLNVDSPGLPAPPNTHTSRSPHPQASLVTYADAGHPASHTSFRSFIFVVNLWGWLMGAGGRGALLGGGWGRVYCSELPVPRGPVGKGGRRASALGPHEHSGHSTGAGGWGEAGRHIALQEGGVRRGPPPAQTGAWGGGWRSSCLLPSLERGGETPQSGAGEEAWGSHVPGPSLRQDIKDRPGHRRGPRAAALVSTPAESISPQQFSCRPPLCPPWPWGARGGPRRRHCQSCSH